MTDSTRSSVTRYGTGESVYGVAGLPFSPAIRVPAGADLVFVSGCLGPATPEDPATDLRSEVARVYRNVARILELAGASMADVVSITKFLVDVERDNEVIAEETVRHLPQLPTSTTVEIARFVPSGVRLEVSAIAAVASPTQPAPDAL